MLEGQETPVDWGVKSVKGDKNKVCLAKIEELVALYEPGVIVLQNTPTTNSRRAPRIKELTRQIIDLTATLNVKGKLFSVDQVRKFFFADGKGTKHAPAEFLAKLYPDELGSRLPPKRKPWMSEENHGAK